MSAGTLPPQSQKVPSIPEEESAVTEQPKDVKAADTGQL